MMKLTELLETSPESLAKTQEKALAEYLRSRLLFIAELVGNGNYTAVKGELAFSPAGDGMGCENQYIAFPDVVIDAVYGTDIGDIIDKLIKLREASNVYG